MTRLAALFQAADGEAFCKEVGLHHSAMLRARNILDQLSQLLKKMGVAVAKDVEAYPANADDVRRMQRETSLRLRRCLVKSCWKQVARLEEGGRSFITVVRLQGT